MTPNELEMSRNEELVNNVCTNSESSFSLVAFRVHFAVGENENADVIKLSKAAELLLTDTKEAQNFGCVPARTHAPTNVATWKSPFAIVDSLSIIL